MVLENLKTCLPILDADHPKEGVAYKRFTFMSDRQKGLLEALKLVFPHNHTCYCAVHIARNVEAKFGAKRAKYIVPLAKTFSTRYATELMATMGEATKKYVQDIEPSQWRSTAWLTDTSLPPRYGIVTSNLSESTNAMFEQARDMPWRSSVHLILSTMVERIGKLSKKYEDKTGVVDAVVKSLEHSWRNCAGMSIVDLKIRTQPTFTVFVPGRGETLNFSVSPETKVCNCGLWQEYGYPCIHAVAFFKKHRDYSFGQLLAEVDEEHTFESNVNLFERNFLTVCLEQLAPDEKTLPPVFKKRKAGRTKKKRIRKRSRFARNTASSNLRCSNCGVAGHNIRTCVATFEEQQQSGGEDEDEEDATTIGHNIPEVDLL